MDKLRAMHTFVTIVDAGSLTAAARSLGSSLPAVVRQLAALEKELGARLLQRTTRRLTLTEAGRLLPARTRAFVEFMREHLERERGVWELSAAKPRRLRAKRV